MHNLKEYYRGIVGREPKDLAEMAQMTEIIQCIAKDSREFDKNVACLFFVDLFKSPWPDCCSLKESSYLMRDAVDALLYFSTRLGCVNAARLNITQILMWVIKNIRVE